MAKNNHPKIMFIFLILIISMASVEAMVNACRMNNVGGDQSKLSIENTTFQLTTKLPNPRDRIPHSLKNHILKTKEIFRKKTKNNLECNANSLCASFDVNTTPENVSSWMGFEVQDNTDKYFIATYSQKATYLGNALYSTPKWDKHHFWMHIGKDVIPLPIQPRFVGIDKESGKEWYTIDYMGYRMANSNIDYSNYWENMSRSALILLINPQTKKVEEYYLEYYDENDEYIGDYGIEIGDELESYFLAFKKGQEEADYLFSLKDITPITSPITFTYEEQYPGKDFNCTSCGDFNFEQAEFKYIFESYGETRSTFTKPQPIVAKNNTVTDSNISENNVNTTKSVPISSFWMFFFFSLFMLILPLKKEF